MKQQPESDFKTTYARLRAKRDAIKGAVKNPRAAKTPFALSFSKRSKPRKGAA
jgi:hypothetical protein